MSHDLFPVIPTPVAIAGILRKSELLDYFESPVLEYHVVEYALLDNVGHRLLV